MGNFALVPANMYIPFTISLQSIFKVVITLAAVQCGVYAIRRGYPLIRRWPVGLKFLRRPRHPSGTNTDIQSLGAQIAGFKRLIDELQQNAYQDAAVAKEEIDTLSRELDIWKRKEGLAQKEVKRQEEAIRRVHDRLHFQAAQVQEVVCALRDTTVLARQWEESCLLERENLQKLLERQDSQLLDARRFLAASAVPLSESDVVDLVRKLNNGIAGLSETLITVIHFKERSPHLEESYEHLERTIGPDLTELLGSVSHQDDPILVHTALKTDMSGFAGGVVSSWDFQHQNHSVFVGIYKQMLKSGKWAHPPLVY